MSENQLVTPIALATEREPLPIGLWNSLRHIALYNKNEVCGLIDSRYQYHCIENAHEKPESNFIMDLQQFKRAIEHITVANERVIGVFHTHPGGSPLPSDNDIAGWPNPELNWRYFIATEIDVYEYEYPNQPKGAHMGGIPLQR